jgi:hypothetical protein
VRLVGSKTCSSWRTSVVGRPWYWKAALLQSLRLANQKMMLASTIRLYAQMPSRRWGQQQQQQQQGQYEQQCSSSRTVACCIDRSL